MRTLRTKSKPATNKAPPRRFRDRGRQPKRGLIVTTADVLWWAKTNNREPFNTAANIIRSSGGRAKHVVWHNDNTLEVVV